MTVTRPQPPARKRKGQEGREEEGRQAMQARAPGAQGEEGRSAGRRTDNKTETSKNPLGFRQVEALSIDLAKTSTLLVTQTSKLKP